MAKPKKKQRPRGWKRTFGHLRIELGISVERASILMDYSVGHLRAVEGGRAPLTEEMAYAMARAYKVHPRELFRDDLYQSPEMPPDDPEED